MEIDRQKFSSADLIFIYFLNDINFDSCIWNALFFMMAENICTASC